MRGFEEYIYIYIYIYIPDEANVKTFSKKISFFNIIGSKNIIFYQ